jgi:hypothetical protein
LTYQQLEAMTYSQASNFNPVGMSDWEEAERWAKEHGGDPSGLGDAIYDNDGATALSQLGINGSVADALNSRG